MNLRRSTLGGLVAALGAPLVACSLALDTTGFSAHAASGDADGGRQGDARAVDAAPAACVRTTRVGSGATSFCVDATEVTNRDYARFLATSPEPRTEGGPAECAAKSSHVPASAWPAATGREDHPVVQVDWCDARAYCAWAGRRLCGRRGGGALDVASASDPRVSEWLAACSDEGSVRFPYGDDYDPFACNGADRAFSGTTSPVGSLSTCVAPSGAFDMSGNVQEWEDACEGDECLARGGAFRRVQLVDLGGASLLCAASLRLARKATRDDTGFRCCAP